MPRPAMTRASTVGGLSLILQRELLAKVEKSRNLKGEGAIKWRVEGGEQSSDVKGVGRSWKEDAEGWGGAYVARAFSRARWSVQKHRRCRRGM